MDWLGRVSLILGILAAALLYKWWSARSTLKEASKLGMSVSRIKRNILSGRDQKIRPEWVLQSSLKMPQKSAYSWSLLQRPKARHSELPEGWQLEELPEPLPENLRNLLLKVTTEWAEGFIELEVAPGRLDIFWDPEGEQRKPGVCTPPYNSSRVWSMTQFKPSNNVLQNDAHCKAVNALKLER